MCSVSSVPGTWLITCFMVTSRTYSPQPKRNWSGRFRQKILSSPVKSRYTSAPIVILPRWHISPHYPNALLKFSFSMFSAYMASPVTLFRPQATIHCKVLGWLLQTAGYLCQSIVRFPSSDQEPDWTTKPGAGNRTLPSLFLRPVILGEECSLGNVSPQFLAIIPHGVDTFSSGVWIPAAYIF